MGDGNCRNIAQGEGCEQGDPLAAALNCALLKAASDMHASDILLAFLDDVYVLTTRERSRVESSRLNAAVRPT